MQDLFLKSISNSDTLDHIIPAIGERGEVFISYSQGTNEHQDWVMKLASKLLRLGVKVSIDAWDARGGEDLAAFMANQTRNSPLVICVCSDQYLQKARDAQLSGVKNEVALLAARVTLKGSKFILPIVKNNTNSEMSKLPDFLPRSKYFDFTDPTKEGVIFAELFARITNLDLCQKPSYDPSHNQKVMVVRGVLTRVQEFWAAPENSHLEEAIMAHLNNIKTSTPSSHVSENPTHAKQLSDSVITLLGGWDKSCMGDLNVIERLKGNDSNG